MAPLPRSATSRARSQRAQVYKPPAALDAPEPPDQGTVYRWVRVNIGADDDAKNISLQARDGWEPVTAETHPDFDAPVYHSARFSGVIGVGDLVLMKNDRSRVEARQEWLWSRAADQLAAVDNDVLKAEDPRMPITRSRQSGVIHGQRKVSVQED